MATLLSMNSLAIAQMRRCSWTTYCCVEVQLCSIQPNTAIECRRAERAQAEALSRISSPSGGTFHEACYFLPFRFKVNLNCCLSRDPPRSTAALPSPLTTTTMSYERRQSCVSCSKHRMQASRASYMGRRSYNLPQSTTHPAITCSALDTNDSTVALTVSPVHKALL